MKKKKIKILGTEWSYYTLKEVKFEEIHADCPDSGALTLPVSKEMCFMAECLEIGAVRHEVRHAFIAELCLESAELTIDQFEEVQCTLDENKWEQMDEASKEIYENLIVK